MNLKNIFAEPYHVNGIGNVYPIRVKDYDDFNWCGSILYLSKNHFETGNDYSLLDLILLAFPEKQQFKHKFQLRKLLSLALRKEMSEIYLETYINGDYAFVIDEEHTVNRGNYECLRKIIMKQNIIHEQKIYKTKTQEEWAKKVLEAKAKKSIKISMEDMITTVSAKTGKDYELLKNYSLYQIYSDFYRLRKDKEHDDGISVACVGSKTDIKDFAEDLDLYHNPYDDLFIDSSKLDGLNKALGGK